MFGISAFAQLPFASVPSAATPVPSEILLGGHFGFDEKKRDEQWAKDRKLEAQRKRKLQEALFGYRQRSEKKSPQHPRKQ
jgi:hypothetical protein